MGNGDRCPRGKGPQAGHPSRHGPGHPHRYGHRAQGLRDAPGGRPRGSRDDPAPGDECHSRCQSADPWLFLWKPSTKPSLPGGPALRQRPPPASGHRGRGDADGCAPGSAAGAIVQLLHDRHCGELRALLGPETGRGGCNGDVPASHRDGSPAATKPLCPPCPATGEQHH